MRTATKSKVQAIVFISLLIIPVLLTFIQSYIYLSEVEKNKEEYKSITIRGNDELVAFAQKHNYEGHGTKEDPIVIMNIGKVTQQIYIFNVSLYVVIRDSIIVMPRYTGLSYDIKIKNCSNIALINITIMYSDGNAIEIIHSNNIYLENIKMYHWGCESSFISILDSKNISIYQTHPINSTASMGIYAYSSSSIYISDASIDYLEIYNVSSINISNCNSKITRIRKSKDISILNLTSKLNETWSWTENFELANVRNAELHGLKLQHSPRRSNIHIGGLIRNLILNNIEMFGGGITISKNINMSGIEVNELTLNSRPLVICIDKKNLVVENVSQLIAYNSTGLRISGYIGKALNSLVLIRSSNITIIGAKVSSYDKAIYSVSSRNIVIENSTINSSRISIDIVNSKNFVIKNNSLWGDLNIVGGIEYWNHTVLGNTIFGKPLLFYYNKSNIILHDELSYTIIAYTRNVTISNAELGRYAKIKTLNTSYIRIDNLNATDSSLIITNCSSISIESTILINSEVMLNRTDVVSISNAFIEKSSVEFHKSKNIVMKNLGIRDINHPIRIYRSSNIKISNVYAYNSSVLYVYGSNNTEIANITIISGGPIEIKHSEFLTLKDIIIHRSKPSCGIAIYFTKNVTMSNIAMFNASLYVHGYIYYFYGSYIAAYGEYTYGVAFKIYTEYYSYTIRNVTVNSLPIFYGVKTRNLVLDKPYGQIILILSKNITIKNQEIERLGTALYLLGSEDIFIIRNKISYANYGVEVLASSWTYIIENMISNSRYGIYILGTNYTKIEYNSFSNINKTISMGYAYVEIKHNYWSNQPHIDRNGDGINDYRFDEIDSDPLYDSNAYPENIVITMLKSTILEIIILATAVYYVRTKTRKLLSKNK